MANLLEMVLGGLSSDLPQEPVFNMPTKTTYWLHISCTSLRLITSKVCISVLWNLKNMMRKQKYWKTVCQGAELFWAHRSFTVLLQYQLKLLKWSSINIQCSVQKRKGGSRKCICPLSSSYSNWWMCHRGLLWRMLAWLCCWGSWDWTCHHCQVPTYLSPSILLCVLWAEGSIGCRILDVDLSDVLTSVSMWQLQQVEHIL